MKTFAKASMTGVLVAGIVTATCLPSMAANWGAFKEDACTLFGIRRHSAQLLNISGSWEAACAGMPATVKGVYFDKPTRCINKGISGMWGEFDVPDSACASRWGSFQNDDCKGIGVHRYSARLENIPGGTSWEYACDHTPANVGGIQFAKPTRCVNKGAFGMWGEFDVPDSACAPRWGSFKKDDCRNREFRRYSSRLEGKIPSGVSWEDACNSTPATVGGYAFNKPTRCVKAKVPNPLDPAGILVEGIPISMWGEFDVPDTSCAPRWGGFKKDDCKGVGFRQYSSRIENVPSGMEWGDACRSTPAAVGGTRFDRPTRCVNVVIPNPMESYVADRISGPSIGWWGQFDVPDSTCTGRWGNFRKDECLSMGVRKYSSQIQVPPGLRWEDVCDRTPATIIGITFARPARCVNVKAVNDISVGMWGEWKVPDSSCPHWGSFLTEGCQAPGVRLFSSRLEDIPDGHPWEDACNRTPATINGISFAKPTRCSNKGALGMWGQFDVGDPSCGVPAGATKTQQEVRGIQQIGPAAQNPAAEKNRQVTAAADAALTTAKLERSKPTPLPMIKVGNGKIEFYLSKPLGDARGGSVPITIDYAAPIRNLEAGPVSLAINKPAGVPSHTIQNVDLRQILKPAESAINGSCKSSLDANKKDVIDIVYDAEITFNLFSPSGAKISSTKVKYRLGVTCSRMPARKPRSLPLKTETSPKLDRRLKN